ncbi:uncharacterized protein LACBIDRAFT_304522 [Laccaria bicolor S238N-H82]|uniref:Predicted protein n=1 Tax=Laccaria bicolor (strain S238N-H82 / ATCC MYA-4686) TaxID=486041 RepID=B0DLT9_LACBS|nr:uncharacterized protein LACBIDRAFT_304522 [Laccaria bicolor S238N-H82]EDR04453.1 predicted protein [Laccaria bicolor S238N-H82]|eukprot:XP_001884972.1 predicted protein [Laccaria bicolor S238N-H82]
MPRTLLDVFHIRSVSSYNTHTTTFPVASSMYAPTYPLRLLLNVDAFHSILLVSGRHLRRLGCRPQRVSPLCLTSPPSTYARSPFHDFIGCSQCRSGERLLRQCMRSR